MRKLTSSLTLALLGLSVLNATTFNDNQFELVGSNLVMIDEYGSANIFAKGAVSPSRTASSTLTTDLKLNELRHEVYSYFKNNTPVSPFMITSVLFSGESRLDEGGILSPLFTNKFNINNFIGACKNSSGGNLKACMGAVSSFDKDRMMYVRIRDYAKDGRTLSFDNAPEDLNYINSIISNIQTESGYNSSTFLATVTGKKLNQIREIISFMVNSEPTYEKQYKGVDAVYSPIINTYFRISAATRPYMLEVPHINHPQANYAIASDGERRSAAYGLYNNIYSPFRDGSGWKSNIYANFVDAYSGDYFKPLAIATYWGKDKEDIEGKVIRYCVRKWGFKGCNHRKAREEGKSYERQDTNSTLPLDKYKSHIGAKYFDKRFKPSIFDLADHNAPAIYLTLEPSYGYTYAYSPLSNLWTKNSSAGYLYQPDAGTQYERKVGMFANKEPVSSITLATTAMVINSKNIAKNVDTNMATKVLANQSGDIAKFVDKFGYNNYKRYAVHYGLGGKVVIAGEDGSLGLGRVYTATDFFRFSSLYKIQPYSLAKDGNLTYVYNNKQPIDYSYVKTDPSKNYEFIDLIPFMSESYPIKKGENGKKVEPDLNANSSGMELFSIASFYSVAQGKAHVLDNMLDEVVVAKGHYNQNTSPNNIFNSSTNIIDWDDIENSNVTDQINGGIGLRSVASCILNDVCYMANFQKHRDFNNLLNFAVRSADASKAESPLRVEVTRSLQVPYIETEKGLFKFISPTYNRVTKVSGCVRTDSVPETEYTNPKDIPSDTRNCTPYVYYKYDDTRRNRKDKLYFAMAGYTTNLNRSGGKFPSIYYFNPNLVAGYDSVKSLKDVNLAGPSARTINIYNVVERYPTEENEEPVYTYGTVVDFLYGKNDIIYNRSNFSTKVGEDDELIGEASSYWYEPNGTKRPSFLAPEVGFTVGLVQDMVEIGNMSGEGAFISEGLKRVKSLTPSEYFTNIKSDRYNIYDSTSSRNGYTKSYEIQNASPKNRATSNELSIDAARYVIEKANAINNAISNEVGVRAIWLNEDLKIRTINNNNGGKWYSYCSRDKIEYDKEGKPHKVCIGWKLKDDSKNVCLKEYAKRSAGISFSASNARPTGLMRSGGCE